MNAFALTVAGVIMTLTGGVAIKYFTKPKPKLTILDYTAKVLIITKYPDRIEFYYLIKVNLHNKGAKVTTPYSAKVIIGKWESKPPINSQARDILAGARYPICLEARRRYPAYDLSSIKNKEKCKIILKYTGSKKPLIDEIELNVRGL